MTASLWQKKISPYADRARFSAKPNPAFRPSKSLRCGMRGLLPTPNRPPPNMGISLRNPAHQRLPPHLPQSTSSDRWSVTSDSRTVKVSPAAHAAGDRVLAAGTGNGSLAQVKFLSHRTTLIFYCPCGGRDPERWAKRRRAGRYILRPHISTP